jgi:hypothetical protein
MTVVTAKRAEKVTKIKEILIRALGAVESINKKIRTSPSNSPAKIRRSD